MGGAPRDACGGLLLIVSTSVSVGTGVCRYSVRTSDCLPFCVFVCHAGAPHNASIDSASSRSRTANGHSGARNGRHARAGAGRRHAQLFRRQGAAVCQEAAAGFHIVLCAGCRRRGAACRARRARRRHGRGRRARRRRRCRRRRRRCRGARPRRGRKHRRHGRRCRWSRRRSARRPRSRRPRPPCRPWGGRGRRAGAADPAGCRLTTAL